MALRSRPFQCIGQNYAYNEASFFLVKLMQQFETFSLAPDAQPQSSLPPAEWKYGRGRQAVERVRPEAAMTLFVKVSDSYPHLDGAYQ